MANLLNYDATQLLAFVVILVRVAGIVGMAPVFGNDNVPLQIKIVLSLLLALLLHPFVPSFQVYPTQTHHYLILIVSEFLIGMVIGIVGKFLFAAVEVAGALAGMQMGLSLANVIDPSSQQQTSLIAQFENVIATLIFLAMDAHHVVIQAMVRSYDFLPPGTAGIGESLTAEIIRLSAGIFVIGFQLGAPLIISLLLANLVLGLLARSVPQIQIFVVGFPLTLFLGILFLMMGMPFFGQALRMMFEMFDNQVFQVLQLLRDVPTP